MGRRYRERKVDIKRSEFETQKLKCKVFYSHQNKVRFVDWRGWDTHCSSLSIWTWPDFFFFLPVLGRLLRCCSPTSP